MNILAVKLVRPQLGIPRIQRLGQRHLPLTSILAYLRTSLLLRHGILLLPQRTQHLRLLELEQLGTPVILQRLDTQPVSLQPLLTTRVIQQRPRGRPVIVHLRLQQLRILRPL